MEYVGEIVLTVLCLMGLGLLGCDEKQSTALLRDFRTRHGALDCADLLRASKERGELRKDHCDS